MRRSDGSWRRRNMLAGPYVIFCQADEFPCAVVCQRISILDLCFAGITHVCGSRRHWIIAGMCVWIDFAFFLLVAHSSFYFPVLSNSARRLSHVLDKDLFLLEIGNKFIDSTTLDGCEILIVEDTTRHNGRKTICFENISCKNRCITCAARGRSLVSRTMVMFIDDGETTQSYRPMGKSIYFPWRKVANGMTSTFHWITLTKEPTFFSSPSRCLLPFTAVYEMRLPQSDNTRVWSCSRHILCVSALPTMTSLGDSHVHCSRLYYVFSLIFLSLM